MSEIPVSSDILGAMITPAVLISASGVLVLSTSNRVVRTVARVRILASEAERLQSSPESISATDKRKFVEAPLAQLSERAVILRSAMTALYTAIGLLVGTSILIGIAGILQWRYAELPVLLGLVGACALNLPFSTCRAQLSTTLIDDAYARRLMVRGGLRA